METLETLKTALSTGKLKSVELVETCLERIQDDTGEGQFTFIHVDEEGARAQANAADHLRAANAELSPYAGIPVSIKDIFDIKNQITSAGSKVLSDSPKVISDSLAVARLRAAGFIIIGRTNMTELAYSGLGLNPHFNTPANPYDRNTRRIPGGSSSGAAVSITDKMAFAALGTDTGGSCRIPAAMSGIVGFKPTASRIPLSGVLPLSTSFDSVGTVTNSVRCCEILDDILSGETRHLPLETPAIRGLRIANLTGYVLNDIEAHVASCFEQALSKLSRQDAQIIDLDIAAINDIPSQFINGGLTAAEAYSQYRELIETRGTELDPRVSLRVEKGKNISSSDYIELSQTRSEVIRKINVETHFYDVVVFPTVPIIAPTFQELEDDENYNRLNLLALRNPMITNYLDRCAISIPIHEQGSAPVGLMLMGETADDRRLLSIGKSIEKILSSNTK